MFYIKKQNKTAITKKESKQKEKKKRKEKKRSEEKKAPPGVELGTYDAPGHIMATRQRGTC